MFHRAVALYCCLLLAFWGLGTGARPATAQSLASRVYTLADGLPQSTVYALTQDSQGQLWAGTQGGASWFDGHRFQTLDTRSGLPDNHVTALAAGPAGGVWLGHYYGAVSAVNAAGRVRAVGPQGWRARGTVRQLLTVGTAAQPLLWVATAGDGLYALDSRLNRQLLHRTRREGLPSDSVNQLCLLASTGQLWVATTRGLSVLDAATGQVLPAEKLPAEVTRQPVNSVFRVTDNNVWCATNNGLFHLTRPPGAPWRVQRLSTAEGLCDNRVLRVLQDRLGRVWLLTPTGIGELENGQPRCFRGPLLQRRDQLTADMLEDREGSVWLVLDDGILQHIPDERFALFGAADGLPDPDVRSILPRPGGEYWVGTRGGLQILQPAAPDGQRFRPGHRRPGGSDANFVQALFEDSRGRVWLGCRAGGAVWEPATQRWRELSNLRGLARQHILSFAEDPRGRIWAATRRAGVSVLGASGTEVVRTYDAASELGTAALWKVFRDRTGTLWLGTDDRGLVRVTLAATNQQPDRFQRVDGRPGRLSVGSISEGQQGRLWLGSIGEGLLCFDGNTTRGFGPEAGLHSNNPYFAQADATGHVWVGTNLGLDRFTPATGRTVSYGPAEGFLGQETNQNAVVLEPGGRLWIGTVNGVMRYDPTQARPNRVPPATRLRGLRIFMQDTVVPAGVMLPHSLNHLTFDYVGVSLTNLAKVQYRYRLAGFDRRWTGPLAATSATYTNLPPGDYTFEVQAANNDGVWNPRPATFAFTIRPPWWRTWWAYLLYTGMFGAVLYGVRRVTQQRERERANRQLERQALEHLQVLDRMKSDFFANISHEFRTPLTLILGPAEQLADNPPTDPALVRKQSSLVVRHARKLLRLINQLLDLSKLEAGALQLNLVPADAATFGTRLLGSFTSMAHSQGVALQLRTPGRPVPLVFDPEKLEDVLSNLLANALRFTPTGGEVTLEVREDAASPAAPLGAVSFVVSDTGTGIAPEHQARLFDRFYQAASSDATMPRTGTGLGLALVKELTELHGGTVAVASEVGQGAVFTVQLPRYQAPAAPEVTPAPPAEVHPQLLAAATLEMADFEVADSVAAVKDTDGAAEADVVLIIEDHPDVRQFIRESLAEDGYQLLEAPDGTAGVQLARDTVPDLVLSDVMMPPGPDGYQVCEQLKTDPATSHIPVVLLTARADPHDKLQGLETGADSYLAKPFNPRELRAQVRNLLALRRRLQSRFAVSGAVAPVATPTAAAPQSMAVVPSLLLSPLEQHAAAVAALPSLDQAFLRRVEQAVESHLDDGEFSVETLSQEVALSRAQLHRKLKALTGQAPSDFIRTTRLLRAHALLQGQVGNVAEVAYLVGFNSPTHFSTSFSKHFGHPPSEVRS
ncbi:hybrid sensor histidine kinase/response regulator transcription factor [Hymenobacter norwichensis]|uniref:hybrid sensor histidine kinase/response regulator transcription factor n=1 Tax=Hymenobacter norwichensis TaxID=223903 RepID=UPI0003B698E7|nr:hybrid sensor histidine kinase/response regulator transcription factor [Hymenobacter norwichensis]